MINLSQLSDVLGKQCVVQKKLLDLENHKTEILLKGDTVALDTLMKNEQALIMECTNTERQREAVEETIGLAGKTLKAIVTEYAPNNESGMQKLFEELSCTVVKLKKVNELNIKILNTRLQTLRFISNEIGLSYQSVTYKRP